MSVLELSASALLTNLKFARSCAPEGAALRAMVKANAYGLGLEALVSILDKDSDEYGVANLDEAIELRELLEKNALESGKKIFIMSGEKNWNSREVLEVYKRFNLTAVISSVEELLELSSIQKKSSEKIYCELKFDTGMSRLGISIENLKSVFDILEKNENIKVLALLTHFACSDELDSEFTQFQEKEFNKIILEFENKGISVPHTHSCNSGALIRGFLKHDRTGENTSIFRPGVMLYGACPSLEMHEQFQKKKSFDSQFTGLLDVASWKAQVSELKSIPQGASVGYGASWKAPSDSKLAILPVGYADGYRRELGGKGKVLINDSIYDVVGRVSMDMISVRVDESVKKGDWATLLGGSARDGSSSIGIWDLSLLCDTIPYEIWTGIGNRVKRKLI